MTKPIIYGDWGTSTGRFHLYDGEKLLARATIPGIKYTPSAHASFDKLIAPWLNTHGDLLAIMCGMVGSNIGWVDAGYVSCPTTADDLRQTLVPISTRGCDVLIVPGVKTDKGLSGLADLMRGEETQVFGWQVEHDTDGLFCLPGTHTKWAQVKDGIIQNFMTSVNGELLDTLEHHSVLVGASDLAPPNFGEHYLTGLEIGATDTPLTQLLMSVRSKQILGHLTPQEAKSYMLGLIIGSDVSAAVKHANGKPITVIGSSGPTLFYAEAIRGFGHPVKIFDGEKAALAGLKALMPSA